MGLLDGKVSLVLVRVDDCADDGEFLMIGLDLHGHGGSEATRVLGPDPIDAVLVLELEEDKVSGG